MFNLCVSISRFIYIILMGIFILCGYYLYLRRPSERTSREICNYQTAAIILFNLLSFVILFFHELQANDWQFGEPIWNFLTKMAMAAGFMLGMHILSTTLHRGTSRLLWNCVFMLLSVSLVVLWRLKASTAIAQIYWMGICFLVVNVVLLIMRRDWVFRIHKWIFAAGCLGLIVLPFLFPNKQGGSLNWVQIRSFGFQPSEFVKIAFVFFLAKVYGRQYKFRSLVEATGMVGILALVLLVQNDLGTTLIFCVLFLLLTYDYTQKTFILVGGILGACLAALVAYKLFGHVRTRVSAWLNPWSDFEGGGYQIAHSLFAIVNGGWIGTGLFQGLPTYIPHVRTDMIFAAIVEEFGAVFGILLVMIYMLIFLFIMDTAKREKDLVRRGVAMGFGILYMLQSFVIIGGVIKLIPLTGVTLPFISYGGSSLLSSFLILGILQSMIRIHYMERKEESSGGKGQQSSKQAVKAKEQKGARDDAIQDPYDFDGPY